jgi:hypothetical protein
MGPQMTTRELLEQIRQNKARRHAETKQLYDSTMCPADKVPCPARCTMRNHCIAETQAETKADNAPAGPS